MHRAKHTDDDHKDMIGGTIENSEGISQIQDGARSRLVWKAGSRGTSATAEVPKR